MGKIDLVLIKPSDKKKIYGQLSDSLSAIEPPIWAGIIAAYVREQGHSVKIIDMEGENLSTNEVANKVIDYAPFLVGFVVTGSNLSASTWNMAGARVVMTALKKKSVDAKTFFWGLHPSALPERTLREEHTDFVCQGEGFTTIIKLLRAIKKGQEEDNYNIKGLCYIKDNKFIINDRSPLIKNLDELPSVAWDLLPMDKYKAHNWHCFQDIEYRQPYGIIYTSLGCPFNCSFCNVKALFAKPGIRYRSSEKVIEDIGVLVKNYNVKNIKVLDECFVLNGDRVIKICDLIIERGFDLNMWVYARIDTVNEKMLKKMKQAGINWIAYGIESSSEKILKGVLKGRYNKNVTKKVVEMTKSADIYVCGNFMLGLPDDDFETMQETLDFAKELNCEYANFYVTMAYPGSKLYENALHKNIKLPETWRGYAQFSEEALPLPTKHLSSADILRFRDQAFKEFYSNPEYIEMIEQKFGQKTVSHIKEMLKHEIHRKFV